MNGYTVALITDCNTAFCTTIIQKFAEKEMIIIAFGKNDDIIQKSKEKLKSMMTFFIEDKILLLKCDVTDLKQVKDAFNHINGAFGGVDILINNNSYDIDCQVSTGNFKDFQEIINTNINSLVTCLNFAAKSMIDRNTKGHIINMNDIRGYEIRDERNISVYLASKASVTSINDILRHEFRYLGANIKVTNVACGRFGENSFNTSISKMEDLVSMVISILDTPEYLQVHEILLEWDPEYSEN